MKRFILFGVASVIFSVAASAQEAHLSVVDNNVPVEGVNILVNGVGYAATDTSGTVSLKNLADGDGIVLSHVLYRTGKLYWPFRDTCITLHSTVFVLDTGLVRAKDDREFLRSVLKPDLHLGSTTTFNRLYTSDTLIGIEYDQPLIFKTKGKAMFPLRNKIPFISISSFDTESELSQKQIKHYRDLMKERIPHITGNGKFFAFQILRHKWKDNLYVEYLGELGEEHVFKFYWTPDGVDKTKAKAKGHYFIGKQDGIIHRICASESELNPSGGYYLVTQFHYFESQNSILPSEVHSRRFFYDSNHNVDTQHFFNFYYEWE